MRTLIKQKLLFILICSSINWAVYGQVKNILFLGNSYTYYNTLPQLTTDIALSLGDSIYWDSNTPGGYTLQGHSTNATSLSKISFGIWDYVIIQEQSQIPSFPPTQVAVDCYPYATILTDSILASNTCAEPVFFMTWGRENGDQTNCVFYPPVCTYNGMQARLRESYLQMSIDNNCTVSPVGAAWKYVRDHYPSIGLYSSDGSHPSIYGSYLSACVHYATVFRKSPFGSTFISTISSSDALILQQAAELIVIDSLSNWRIGANDIVADFNYQTTGTTLDFTFNGQNADSIFWDFGNGSNSTDINPSHNFQIAGNYNVTVVAFNQCDSDTLLQTITISTTDIIKEEINFSIKQTENYIELVFSNSAPRIISLADIQGRLLIHKNINSNHVEFSIPSNNFYLLKISEKGSSKTLKLISQ